MDKRDDKGRFKKNHKPYFSDEHRQKISEAKKGKKFSSAHKRKLSQSHKGRKLSLETRKNMSIAQTGRVITWGDKISASLKGKTFTKQRRKQMSLDQGGKNVVDSALYKRVHKWIVELEGKANKCELCGDTDPSKRYEWSNISQDYLMIVEDWWMLCKQCHVNYDIQIKKVLLNEVI